MPFPQTAQLKLGLNFRPGPDSILGTRIHLAAQMPDGHDQPTAWLTAVLQDMTPENWDGQLPVHRLVVDEGSHDSELVQQIVADRQANLAYESDARGNDDGIKRLIAEEMDKPPILWLEFASARWIASMDDEVYLCAVKGVRKPLGKVFQLSIF